MKLDLRLVRRISPRGMTMVEVMIVTAVIAIVLLIIGAAARSCLTGPEQVKAARKEARAWADDLGIQVTGVSCNDVDSDGDGYVSCTLALPGGATKQIECRGAYSWGHGCRDPKFTIPVQR